MIGADALVAGWVRGVVSNLIVGILVPTLFLVGVTGLLFVLSCLEPRGLGQTRQLPTHRRTGYRTAGATKSGIGAPTQSKTARLRDSNTTTVG